MGIHVYKAIRTRYYGPGNVRGSRIVAEDGDGNRTSLHYDDALDRGENHRLAAQTLADKLGWRGDLVGGGFKDDRYWCFTHSGV